MKPPPPQLGIGRAGASDALRPSPTRETVHHVRWKAVLAVTAALTATIALADRFLGGWESPIGNVCVGASAIFLTVNAYHVVRTRSRSQDYDERQ
jgi:hypothetical protein